MYLVYIILLGMYLPDSINTSTLHQNICRLLHNGRAHNNLSITTLACTIGSVRILKIELKLLVSTKPWNCSKWH